MDAFKQPVSEWIQNQVDQAWEQGKGVLLAQLGAEIAKHPAQTQPEMKGMKVKAFINQHLKGKVQLVTHPKHSLAILALPSAANVRDESKLLDYFPVTTSTKKVGQRHRYRNALIQAFVREIAPGKKRYIELDPVTRFVDVDMESEIPSTAFLLESSYIVDKEASEDELIRAIDNWIKNNDASLEEAMVQQVRTDNQTTLLELMIKHLTAEQAARMQIPFDVVIKMHNIKV